jgi:two-component system, chemotaxis family, protein-glutamate methylesterase/glutaminase
VSKPRIIVIGASAGGLEVLTKLIKQFPEELPAAVFVVMHMAATSSAEIVVNHIQKHTRISCKVAVNKAFIQSGNIYLAPADHHLLISGNYMLVTQGPRENQFRPAIDPLFRSAAASYSSSVIGIVLSGMLHDGTVGMDAVKRSGGISIIQHPEDAPYPDMPLSVLKNVEVDHAVPVAEMGELVMRLLQEKVSSETEAPYDIKVEARIAERVMGTTEEIDKIGKRVPYTCPECGGNLWELSHGSLLRYRCHLGHTFSGDSLMNTLNEELEESLWIALRILEERKNLLSTMVEQEERQGPKTWASGQRERVDDIKVHINRIREVLMSSKKPEDPEKIPPTD